MPTEIPVVITGVASGIGAATTELLSSQGFSVIGVDRSEPSTFTGSLIQGDLSTPKGIATIVEAVADVAPEGIAGLANIAGVPGTLPWEAVFSINVFGVRDLTRALMPSLLPNSTVVNLASSVAHQWRNVATRCAEFALEDDRARALASVAKETSLTEDSYLFSKQCVRFLTEYMAAQYLPQRVRVNSVSPGPVETPILEEFKKNHGREKVDSASALLGRFGTPSDIATVIAFLLSPGAAWINGTDIRVDGGLVAHRTHESRLTR